MKRQIRKNVFETNSSSTHTLTMCLKSDYDKWENGEVLLYGGWGYSYPKEHKPVTNHFYPKEEVIAFEKACGNLSECDTVDWEDEKFIEYLKDCEWYTYESYDVDNFEYFEDTYTTPSGETVVAFGQYGYDG